MGILDDAIREHLELKRKHGARDAELEQLEDEAFGPPSRPGEPDFPERPPTGEEAAVEPFDEVEPAEPTRILPPEGGEEGVVPGPTSEPELEEAGIDDDVQPVSPFYDQGGDEAAVEPGLGTLEDEDEDEDAVEVEAEAEVEVEVEEHRSPEPPFDETAEHPAPEPPTSDPIEPPPIEPPPAEPITDDELEVGEIELEVDEEFEEFREVEDEREGDSPGETDEQAAVAIEPEGEATFVAGDEDEEEEDVLEETPEFLRDTPEDERLWFEQGEPRDFDFDDDD